MAFEPDAEHVVYFTFVPVGRRPDIRNRSGRRICAVQSGFYAQAAREKKPIIIDFYADWCAPCKELDEKTFSTRAVIDESKKFIMIKVDLTSAGDPQVEALRNKHQAVGVPTLVYLAPDGNEISKLRGTGFETKEEMVEKMKMALTVAGS